MKRNNIFMWAYITFIILCSAVRMIQNYPLWTYILLAITVSGIFFAIEDLCLSISKMMDDFVRITAPFHEKMQKNNEKKLKFVEEMETKIEVLQKDDSGMIDIIKKNKTDVLNQKNALQGLEETIRQQQKTSERCQGLASKITYLGFLCLLCIMLSSSFFTISKLVQELLTVIPFAIILITKQIVILTADKIQEQRAKNAIILKTDEKITQYLKKMVKLYEELAGLVEEKVKLLEELERLEQGEEPAQEI